MRDICKHSGTSPPPLPTASASVYYFAASSFPKCCLLIQLHSSALWKFPLQLSSCVLNKDMSWRVHIVLQKCMKANKPKGARRLQLTLLCPCPVSLKAPDCCPCWMCLGIFILQARLRLCRFAAVSLCSVHVCLSLNSSSSRMQGMSMGREPLSIANTSITLMGDMPSE